MSRTVAPETIRAIARSSGADLVGFTSADPFSEAQRALIARKQLGMGGPLHFTYDDPETAGDVRRTYPWAKSLVVLGHDYTPRTSGPASRGAVVARFATRDHYEALRDAAGAVASELRSAGARAEVLIDDNRLLDRAAATRAGLGWIGRSTMVLSPGHGPWTLFGSVVTDADLPVGEAMTRTCGACVACIPACPTGAISDEGLDARKCIAAWLQAPGSLPLWIRPLVERRIYGCDDCLDACPPGFPAMARSPGQAEEMGFAELLAADDDTLVERFGWWYVPGGEARFLRRNILVAAGNSGEEPAVEHILTHLGHPSSLVRGHAYWALARSLGPDAWSPLRESHATETVPHALVELERAMLMVRAPFTGRGLPPGRVAEPVPHRHHRLGVDLANP